MKISWEKTPYDLKKCGWAGITYVKYDGSPSVADPGGFIRTGFDINICVLFGIIVIRIGRHYAK